MIAYTNRFHGRGGIRKLYGAGKTIRGGALSLKYSAAPGRSGYRLAVVVSRKVSKSAVVRNRIRRRLYERVRILSGNLNGPYDLIITVYDEQIAAMPAEKLAIDVAALCTKAKILAATPANRGIVEARRKP